MLESKLARRAKHTVYVSFAPEDRDEAEHFMSTFDNLGEVFLTRGPELTEESIHALGDESAALSALREQCLKDSAVTIVLLGKKTWNSAWVDWEIAATLAGPEPSGLLSIELPSLKGAWAPLPTRLSDNAPYAVSEKYPPTPIHLAKWINAAAEKDVPVHNERHLLGFSFAR
ncbi:TIR domain-containing protein [Corynebacterium glucuronolyticum]|uniref:TIR domain-containing protein n=2 Tax=Corynebacterium glucuronolyticum TaxID=39791 RepID=A0AAX1L693_9CORY|nr:TIR domain-containing protein [Corynebacterium glucuronolyticum]EEI27001.1 hypothetical protein HMPREF0294_1625 [Corynebacterium glucuronolyticum ATCC 51867]EEI62275.1 hypothetical protein HMPREF0293_2400 [Corynebacterium glucuronolyticum ATCC 51866]QQU89227.1 TIR domain-containing protein [Corynebacterium glucuronolyticum]QRO82879.1 TIR domain-containing protein [Corynebacterium glucuronolyticum]QRP69874.1 TIR domain-containing protein [Corynebacterium glucuronolyticum]